METHLGVGDGMIQETDAADNLANLGDSLAVISSMIVRHSGWGGVCVT